MITVCKDCPKRRPGCHGDCEWYKVERKALDKENTRRRNESAAKTQQDLMQADTGNIGEKENEGKCIRHSI